MRQIGKIERNDNVQLTNLQVTVKCIFIWFMLFLHYNFLLHYYISLFELILWLSPGSYKEQKMYYSLKEQILAYLKYYFTIFLFLKTPSERKMIYYNTIIAILSLLPWMSFSSVLKEINNKIKRYIVFLPLYSSTGLFTTKNQETLFNFKGNILLERLETHHKLIKFFIKDFFSKCDQIRKKFPIWSYLLEKPLMENIIFLSSERFADNCQKT